MEKRWIFFIGVASLIGFFVPGEFAPWVGVSIYVLSLLLFLRVERHRTTHFLREKILEKALEKGLGTAWITEGEERLFYHNKVAPSQALSFFQLYKEAGASLEKPAEKKFKIENNEKEREEVSVVPLKKNYLLWNLTKLDTSAHSRHQRYELMQEVLEGSPIGVVTLNSEGQIFAYNKMFLLLINKATKSLNKDKYDCLEGLPLSQFINKEKSEGAWQELRHFLAGKTIQKPCEVYLLGNDEMVVSLYFSSTKHVQDFYTLYFVDVTEHKKLSLQLSQSQKMQAIGQLAGGIAHDFNNLLTAMIGFCDLLLQRHSPGDLSYNDLIQIKQNANRAADLVRQLLAFSRQQTLQPKVIDITDALAELTALLRRLIGPAIDLRVVHERNLGHVKVDLGQFEQVIINLAVNARDAMPEGGRLTISTKNLIVEKNFLLGHETVPAGEYVLIKVTDTGIGITPENLSRIFDPFFSTKALGTGLGLSTVYGIVKQTEGFIHVESLLGIGTTFTIYLPKYNGSNVDEPILPAAKEAAKIADLSGTATIILVEDEDAVRIFAARALRDKGYQVYDVSGGKEALALLDQPGFKCDLVVTDVVMAPLDGPALVKKIRERNSQVKVIFTSGYTEGAFRNELNKDESAHFLAKPFALKELAYKVKEVITS